MLKEHESLEAIDAVEEFRECSSYLRAWYIP